MDRSETIKRGRNQLAIRLRNKGICDDSVHDLLKIPIEVLYQEALREVGEQEAYIDELRDTVKKQNVEITILRGMAGVSNQLNKEQRLQIKREELYQQQNVRNLALSKRNKGLMATNSELVMRIMKLETEIKALREQVK